MKTTGCPGGGDDGEHGGGDDDVVRAHVDAGAGEYAVGDGGDGRVDGRAGGGDGGVLHGDVAVLNRQSLVTLTPSLRGGADDDGGDAEDYGCGRGDGDADAGSGPVLLALGGGPLHFRSVP